MPRLFQRQQQQNEIHVLYPFFNFVNHMIANSFSNTHVILLEPYKYRYTQAKISPLRMNISRELAFINMNLPRELAFILRFG